MKPLKNLLISAAIIFSSLIGQAQSIELELSSAALEVEPGQTATTIITTKGISGFTGQIFLKISTSELISSAIELTTDLILPPYTEKPVLSITPPLGTTDKTYSITVEAYNGNLSATKTIIFRVSKPSCSWGFTSVDVDFVDINGEPWRTEFPDIYKSAEENKKYSLPNYQYRTRFIDKDNNFWFATDKGIVKFDGKSATVLNMANNNLPINNINFVIIDSNKTMWIANKNALFKQENGIWKNVNFNSTINNILDLKLDRKNTIWVVGKNDNLNYSDLYKISQNIVTVYNKTNSCLPESSFWKINFDLNNALWTGLSNLNSINQYTKENSILKFDGQNWEFWTRKESRPYNHYLYDSNCKIITNDNTSGYDAFYIGGVEIDGNNNKWILVNGMGGNDGLFKFNDKIWKNFNSAASGTRPFGNLNKITVSPLSKIVYAYAGNNNSFVYEDCDSPPLSTNANFNRSTNEVIFTSQGNNLFQIKSQLNIDDLVLMNLTGTELRTDVSKTNVLNVDYSGYASGLYLVKVLSNNQVFTKKLRIE